MLKRWRYVGVYGPAAMLCVGSARVGPIPQAWWAVWDREAGRLSERTLRRVGSRVRVDEPGRALVHDGAVRIELELDEEPGVEVVSADGRGYLWTRKQGGIAAHATVELEGRRIEVSGPAFVDDSAGYFARRTAWRWSAGTGTSADGRAVAWNLVDGVHDAARDSERTVWVDGEAREVGPVGFADDLSVVSFAEGGELRCFAEAVRERDDNLLVFRSRYRQPFGTFSGTLPGGVELAEGYGVMEDHEAVW
jgi:hypothetical protein